MSIKRYIYSMIAVFVTAAAALSASAQSNYPDKRVRIIVPSAAGGPVDPLTRVVADQLSKQLGQPFIVENRPGAGGRIGTDAAVGSAPDGYTLLSAASSVVVNPLLYPKNAYSIEKDLTPIGVISRTPMLVVVSPKLGVRTLMDLVKLVKDKPGSVNYGISGIGTLDQLVIERLRTLQQLDMVRIDYQGVPQALNALLAGDIPTMVLALNAALPQIKAGKVIPLAITSATRSASLPDVPTMAEAGVGNVVMYGWATLFVPSGVPAPITQKLHDEVAKALVHADVRKLILLGGGESVGLSLSELKEFVRNSEAVFGEVVRASNIHIN
jgi:tripartite-type tricarboxylate transporter receptor subunit TctC